jgi:ubiquinone biosynthesis protein
MPKIKDTYKNLKRSRKIVGVFVKHGMGYFFDLPQVEKYLNFSGKVLFGKKDLKTAKLTLPARLRVALEELGPTFIKLGQVVSTRPDLVDPELIEELSKLQDKVNPISTEIIKKQIEKELGKSVDDLFAYFAEKPIAAASLSQVHKAKLKTGEIVAVKVQRPGVTQTVENDISILYELVDLLEKNRLGKSSYSPKEFVDEFSQTIREEMDFSLEAKNAEKFAKNFSGSTTIKIPKFYEQFTTKKIIVTEFINGVKINKIIKSENSAFNKHVIASSGVDMALQQIFIDGFFHGDLHPGNIFILEDNVIALVDFGMVGRIDRETMNDLADIFFSLTKFKVDNIIKGLEKLDIITADADSKKIKREINMLITRYYGLDLKDLEVRNILADILEVIRKNNIRIPSDFALLFKTLMTAEGTARELYPEFNMVEHVEPFVRELVRKKYSPQEIIREGAGLAEDFWNTLRKFPDNLDWLFKSLKQGSLYIGLEHRGLEKIDTTIDRASNRIAFSMIISSLIIGSSFIMSTNIRPFFFGYPILGVVGFLFAAILGLWLVISIIRGGRL